MRMHALGALVCCVVTTSAWMPAVARAYSDPTMFGAPIEVGGGGGRWFTGSVRDGFTCAVCHGGGARAPLRVEGLPLSGYVRGATYEVVVDWPDTAMHAGVALEVTDAGGRAAGVVQVPEGSALSEVESCQPAGARIPAAFVEPVADARSVVVVSDCGARQLRLRWTAPVDTTQTTVRFSGAFVVGNGASDVHGDGVTTFERTLHPRGEALSPQPSATCAVRRPGQRHGTGAGIVLLLWLTRGLRRRRVSRG